MTANGSSAIVPLTRSRDFGARKRALVTVKASGVQQSGSSASTRPSASSSMQLSQISDPRVVDVVVVAGVVVVLLAGVLVVVVGTVVVVAGVTLLVTLLVFCPGFGSGTGLDTVAVLVTVPPVAVTVYVTVMV